MTYTLQSDIVYTATYTEIKEFATGHGCTLSKLQKNGPAGGNHLCDFTSNNLNHIQELADQLRLPYSYIQKD